MTTAGAMETVGWQLLPCRRGPQWARDPLELPCNGTGPNPARLTRCLSSGALAGENSSEAFGSCRHLQLAALNCLQHTPTALGRIAILLFPNFRRCQHTLLPPA